MFQRCHQPFLFAQCPCVYYRYFVMSKSIPSKVEKRIPIIDLWISVFFKNSMVSFRNNDIEGGNIQLQGRFEMKYPLTNIDQVLLRQRLLSTISHDPNAGENGCYRIDSLYFDNYENKAVFEKTSGVHSRIKWRIRIYNQKTDSIHLEKKAKENNQIFKSSCLIKAKEVEIIRNGEVKWLKEDPRPLMRELYIHMTQYLIRPRVIVGYDREAFVYPYGNVRITFDKNIQTSIADTNILHMRKVLMVPASLDHPHVLEVKYDNYLPEAVRNLLELSGRPQEAYSKYLQSRIYG